MNQPPIYKPHDKFFKEAFSRIEVVRSFIESYLLQRIQFQINLDELQLFQNDSVDSNLKESFSDIIYKTEIIPVKIPIYLLFEHKSYPDPQTGTQLDNYIHMLRENLTKSHSGDILYVIPIIIYHGEMNWDFSIHMPLNRKLSSASKYAQNFNYEFFDISHIPDDQIRGSALLRIVFLTMKYIHNQQILNKLDDILVIFEEMSHEVNISNDLNTFALYIETAAPQNLRQQLSEKIKSWERRDDMPEISKTFQRLKDEGRVEGKMEDAQEMIRKGMSKKLIQEVTGLSLEKIIELENKIKKQSL